MMQDSRYLPHSEGLTSGAKFVFKNMVVKIASTSEDMEVEWEYLFENERIWHFVGKFCRVLVLLPVF
jgi:hypothetical protein